MMKRFTQKNDRKPSFLWVMMQKWEHVLFIHQPIDPEALTGILPVELELDTFDGKAWVSIVALKVSRNRFRYLPAVPAIRSMLQINVRTYVKKNGETGVYFFTMDTNKLSVVLGGKVIRAPFLHADMQMHQSVSTYYIDSLRSGKQSAAFQADYTPIGQSFYPAEQSLDYWLLERYIFWTSKKGQLYRGAIWHEKWKVNQAKVNIDKESMFPFLPEKVAQENAIGHYACSKVAFNGVIKKAE